MTMGEYIKKLRTEKDLTQEELGQLLTPKVNRGAINKWEVGRVTNIKRSYVLQMAKIFGVDPVSLMCFDSAQPSGARQMNDIIKIPMLGRVACGEPLYTEQNIIGDVFVDPHLSSSGTLFALRSIGRSMEPRINDGDTLIIREQQTAEDGDIVIATINGDEGTCKKLRKYPDHIVLVPLNPVYEPLYYNINEVESLPVRIVGKVIQVRHDF